MSTRSMPRRIYRDGVELSVVGFGGVLLSREYRALNLEELAELRRLANDVIPLFHGPSKEN